MVVAADVATARVNEFLAEQLGTARALLGRAEGIMRVVMNDSVAAVTQLCSDEISDANRAGRREQNGDQVLTLLEGTAKSPATLAPTLSSLMSDLTSNSYDQKLSNPRRKQVNERIRTKYERRKAAQHTFLMSLLVRMRGKHATPPAIVRRSLELKYYATSRKVWRLQCFNREAMSESWVDKVLSSPGARSFVAHTDEEWNSDIEMHVRDNLEWYVKIRFNRQEGGKLLKSEIKHTVTGEVFYTPASLTRDIESVDLGDRCHVSLLGWADP